MAIVNWKSWFFFSLSTITLIVSISKFPNLISGAVVKIPFVWRNKNAAYLLTKIMVTLYIVNWIGCRTKSPFSNLWKMYKMSTREPAFCQYHRFSLSPFFRASIYQTGSVGKVVFTIQIHTLVVLLWVVTILVSLAERCKVDQISLIKNIVWACSNTEQPSSLYNQRDVICL